MEMTVNVGYGKTNFPRVRSSYASMVMSPPFSPLSAITSGRPMGAKTVQQTGTDDTQGAVITSPVGLAVGSILRLQASWFQGHAPLREGVLWIRIRPDAGLLNVMASIPQTPDNVIGSEFCMFSGHGDLLIAEDLKKYKIEVPEHFKKRFCNLIEVQEVFRVLEVAPARAPRPAIVEIQTPEGTVLKEVAQAPRRRIITRVQG